MNTDLVLFDLDNTLLAGDSDHGWAQFLIDIGVLDGPSYEARNDAFFAQYKAGTLDIYEFLEFQLAPLAQHPRTQLDAWHAQFMREKILPMITPASRALVARHLAEGSLCAVVTATNDFVTAPIAREFGIPHLVATRAALSSKGDGAYTGKPDGLPCFREAKLTRVDEWLAGLGRRWQDFGQSHFYSDSHNDLPLLARVTDPVAVDPDDTLLAHARQLGWPVISLR
jgi:HAD superfamily hydrolase (TIGR01490 family)